MKFTQFEVVDWTDGKGRGYTIFALGEDGRVYKSIPKFPGPNHTGWIPLADEILPQDFKVVRFDRAKKKSSEPSSDTTGEVTMEAPVEALA